MIAALIVFQFVFCECYTLALEPQYANNNQFDYLRPARNKDPFSINRDALTFGGLLYDNNNQTEKDKLPANFTLDQYVTMMYFAVTKVEGSDPVAKPIKAIPCKELYAD